MITLRLQSYTKRWAVAAVQKATDTLNLLGILTTLIGGAGFSAAGLKFGWVLLVLLAVYIVGLVIWTKPAAALRLDELVSRMVTLDDLKHLEVMPPRVGLLGKENVGKTTFLDSTVARVTPDRQTAQPLVQVTVVPDSNPTSYLAIIDTVGQRDFVQFSVQALCDIILLFLDHNESASATAISEARLDLHTYFTEQLISAKSDIREPPYTIVIIMNKSDLWQQNGDSSSRIAVFVDKIRSLFVNSQKYQRVELVEQFSNRRMGDGAQLLRKLESVGSSSNG